MFSILLALRRLDGLFGDLLCFRSSCLGRLVAMFARVFAKRRGLVAILGNFMIAVLFPRADLISLEGLVTVVVHFVLSFGGCHGRVSRTRRRSLFGRVF